MLGQLTCLPLAALRSLKSLECRMVPVNSAAAGPVSCAGSLGSWKRPEEFTTWSKCSLVTLLPLRPSAQQSTRRDPKQADHRWSKWLSLISDLVTRQYCDTALQIVKLAYLLTTDGNCPAALSYGADWRQGLYLGCKPHKTAHTICFNLCPQPKVTLGSQWRCLRVQYMYIHETTCTTCAVA